MRLGGEVHLQMEMTGAFDDGSVLCYCRGIGVPAIILAPRSGNGFPASGLSASQSVSVTKDCWEFHSTPSLPPPARTRGVL